MRVTGTHVYMKAPEKFATDGVLWKHSTDRMLDQSLRIFSHDHIWSRLTLTTIVSGMCKDHAICPLLAGHLYFLGVDHDNMIATDNMRSVGRLVLAADNHGNLAGHTAQHLVFSINDNPTILGCGFVDVLGFVTIMIHWKNVKILLKTESPLKKGHKSSLKV